MLLLTFKTPIIYNKAKPITFTTTFNGDFRSFLLPGEV